MKQIKRKKGIPENDDLLDRAGRAELAANDFRITQTEERLATVKGEEPAIQLHRKIGGEVREAIRKIQGVMPEELAPELNIKTVQKRVKEATKRLLPNSQD
ncbi:MAG: DNA-damage-inducible protein D [Acidobacteria bacterium]|nr:DNA-damage-inducible protein D [Acidobacteriota bacterium]